MRHGGSHRNLVYLQFNLGDSLCARPQKSCCSVLGLPEIAQMSPVPWRLCLSVWFEGSLVLGDATTVGDELNCVNTRGQKPASKLSLGAYYEAWG